METLVGYLETDNQNLRREIEALRAENKELQKRLTLSQITQRTRRKCEHVLAPLSPESPAYKAGWRTWCTKCGTKRRLLCPET